VDKGKQTNLNRFLNERNDRFALYLPRHLEKEDGARKLVKEGGRG